MDSATLTSYGTGLLDLGACVCRIRHMDKDDLLLEFKFDENKSHDLYEKIELSLCEAADVKGDDN